MSLYDAIHKKIYFLCGSMEVKNNVDKNAEHKQNINTSFLKQGREMNGFYLNRGQCLKASRSCPV